ncbi:MAG: hypothetical protein CVV03_05835 [Firmicutes bacterium HGW-Firmicutes-8]|nr:MAG: hypothetical protein CVV03_05835 [Firmicutes bacterium HGW-Firmicutes-8]
MFQMKKKLTVILVACMIALTIVPPVLAATPTGSGSYSASKAISYAEKYVLNYNPAYKYYYSDCTNFVSQCLYAGGWPYANTSLPATDNYAWWYKASTSTNSNTWSVADRLYAFSFLYTNPYRGMATTRYSGTTTVNYPSGVSKGDIIFYDWTSDGNADHASIYVVDGTDPVSKSSGALIDQHTYDRQHAIWTLNYYNTNRSTTTIKPVHLYSSF